MYKRIICLLMALLLTPIMALAEETPVYQTFQLGSELPEILKEPLAPCWSTDARLISGAAIQHNSIHLLADEPGSRSSYSALLLADLPDSLHLLCAAWVDGSPWQVNDFSRFLRRSEKVSIGVYQPEPNRIPQFRVDYAMENGSISDLMIFRGNRLWHLSGHLDESAGLVLEIGLDSITVTDPQGKDMYVCAEGYWMDYLEDIAPLPTSRADAETLAASAESIFVSNTAAGRAYTNGANLRLEPTQASASLGMYNAGTPLTLLGDEVQGKQYPWLHVRIGSTEGWMSRNYLIEQAVQDYPLPMGRTAASCPLYASPEESEASMVLPAGTTFHILTETQGLYHVCIPAVAADAGYQFVDISWEAARDGLYGYIPTEYVLTGAGVSALDALEAAQ